MSQLSVSWQSVGHRVCVRQCGTFSIMYKLYILQVWGLPQLTSWTIPFLFCQAVEKCCSLMCTSNSTCVFVTGQCLNHAEPTRKAVQTSIDGLVPIVVSLTKYYAFKNKCHQKCSAFRSSWLIGWENIWVTKPSLLRHRKVLLQCYAGEKDNKCKQLIVAFKVLRNKTSLSVLQLCFLLGSLGGNLL